MKKKEEKEKKKKYLFAFGRYTPFCFNSLNWLCLEHVVVWQQINYFVYAYKMSSTINGKQVELIIWLRSCYFVIFLLANEFDPPWNSNIHFWHLLWNHWTHLYLIWLGESLECLLSKTVPSFNIGPHRRKQFLETRNLIEPKL